MLFYCYKWLKCLSTLRCAASIIMISMNSINNKLFIVIGAEFWSWPKFLSTVYRLPSHLPIAVKHWGMKTEKSSKLTQPFYWNTTIWLSQFQVWFVILTFLKSIKMNQLQNILATLGLAIATCSLYRNWRRLTVKFYSVGHIYRCSHPRHHFPSVICHYTNLSIYHIKLQMLNVSLYRGSISQLNIWSVIHCKN